MGRACAIALLVVTFSNAAIAQDAKPAALTPKEIADGWILLFDGETTFGWKIDGNTKIEKGALVLGGTNATKARFTTRFAGDYELYFEFRSKGDKNQYLADGSFVHDGITHPLVVHGACFMAGDWHKLLVKYSRNNHNHAARFYIFDEKNNDWQQGGGHFNHDGSVKSSSHELTIEVAAGGQVEIRQCKMRPTATKSLFNGKDLAGWKIFPGKKSEFAVIDGAINIKDGPGDLQTEKQFGDFLLQMECISHGKHLNSGVFFRCRPNEYQNGYEAQVRNQFTEKPTQKYLLEEYDPATHKLLGKQEALFTAVDFGTGAIYRRQPARKEMSKDGEWFTMTVAAHGNHIGTWVNGVQVTDWFDHRPKTDNARTGCRLEAGHISLQGHDPTTNLSFRNFRIQEYPTK